MTDRTARWLAVAATTAFVALHLPVLGDQTWRHADEHLYTDAVIRMLERGDLITARAPTGAPRFHKPLLTYWTLAASFRTSGIGLAAARLPFLLVAALPAWVTWRSALVWLRSPPAALLAVVILLCHPETVQLAVRVTPDVLLCLFASLSLLGFAMALVDAEPAPGAALWAWTGAGLSIGTRSEHAPWPPRSPRWLATSPGSSAPS